MNVLEVQIKASVAQAQAAMADFAKTVRTHFDAMAKSSAQSLGEMRKNLNAVFDSGAGKVGAKLTKEQEQIKQSFESTGKALAGFAGAAVAAGAAAAGAIAYLGSRGTEVSQIETAFRDLTASVGETASAMLGAGRTGARGLISDFELMKASNKAVLLGMKVSRDDFGLLAEAAVKLGSAMGVDATRGLDNLIEGFGKGSAELLNNLGIILRAEDAYKSYALSLGKTVEALTAEEKQQAVSIVGLELVRKKLAEMGEVQLSFGLRVQQAQVGVQNFTDSLSKAVALSPVLNAGLGYVVEAMQRAFGANQTETVATLIGYVNSFAQGVVTAGQVAVSVAQFITNGWQSLKYLFATVMQGLAEGAALVQRAIASLLKITPTEGMQAAARQGRELADSMVAAAGSFEQQRAEAARGIATNDQFFGGMSAGLKDMGAKMEAAGKEGPGKLRDSIVRALNDARTKGVVPLSEEVKKLIAQFSGQAAQKEINDLAAAFEEMGRRGIPIAVQQMEAFQAAIDAAVAKGAKLPSILTPDTLKVGEAGKKIGKTLVNFTANQIRHDMSTEAKTLWLMAEDAAARSGKTAGEEFSKLVGGSFVNLGQQIGQTFHSTFSQILGEGVALFGKLAELGKLKLGEAAKNIATALSAALSAFMSGFGAGQSKGKVGGAGIGALSGAAAGAAAGSVIPGIGTVAGAIGGGIIGAIGGIFGGASRDRAAAKQNAADLQALRHELIQTYGSMEQLRKVASGLGIDMSKAFTTKSAAELKQMMEGLSLALEQQQKRLEGLSTASGGFNGLAQQWAKALGDTGSTAETQAQFDRLGTYASAIFAGIVKETGDVIGALRQIGPGLDEMLKGQEQFGLEASATTERILGLYGVVAANEDAANSLTYLNQLMSGLGDAGMHSQELFTAFGQDAAQVFADLTAGGATGEQALALMQPTLQELWEMQRDYGYEVDATTQALIDQAVEQGLVGDNMRSVNEKILEVLLGIAKVFNADIPEGLRRTNQEWNNLNHTAGQTPWPNGNSGDGTGEGGYQHGNSGTHHAFGGTIPFTPGGRRVTVAEMETEHIMTSRQLDAIVSRAIGSAMRQGAGGRGGGGPLPPIRVDVKLDNEVLGRALVRKTRSGQVRIHKSAVGAWR